MNPTGGNGIYTYQWQTSENYGSTWSSVVSTSKTYSAYAFNAASTNTHLKLRCTVSSGTQTQVFNHAVDCTDCSFGFSAFQTNTNDTGLTGSTEKTGNQTTFERNIDNGEAPKVLAVFPNPTSDQVSIELFAARREENLILIVDATGNIVKRDLVSSEEHTMDAGHLLPGVYYVIVSNSAGRWVERLIIKK